MRRTEEIAQAPELPGQRTTETPEESPRDYRTQVCRYCGITVGENKRKYCSKSPENDPDGKNSHRWEYPTDQNGQPREPLPVVVLPILEMAKQSTMPTSNAGGKRKPRSPARTVVYVEKLFATFTLEQRRAMYAMLVSVTEPDDPTRQA